jgi:N-acetyl-anhydromuramyl-L-alanine amidase AmpD
MKLWFATVVVLLGVVLAPGVASAKERESGKQTGPASASSSLRSGHVRAAEDATVDCPPGLDCRFVPAAYQQNSSDPSDYGNYDLANREADGLDIRFVVVHDTEVGYDDTIALFQNPLAYASAHYVTRSADGQVTEMVAPTNVAWHAGNWWVNTHSVGIENEGFALQGYQWFTPQLYSSLARLTRYLAKRYDIPLDREHLIGHDQVPGTFGLVNQRNMHWDPGPYFNWARFMAMVGAPITPRGGERTGRIVTIDPAFERNKPPLEGQPEEPANFVYLHSAPSEDSPLIGDVSLAGTAVEPAGVGTLRADDWGDKAVTGQSFVVAERRSGWTAIWYGGQKAWLHDEHVTIPGSGVLVRPKAGVSSIPVYGRAYPESVSTEPLPYTIPAGQVYVAKDLVQADYYNAPTFTTNVSDHQVVKGTSRFYVVSFNHRLAFLKSTDVDVVK